ncbi:MAG: hypothetical protein KDJ78_03440 [Rhodobacteraceae bacterium]|nr:hypothetical protein [Paracoccaceae bacterium]MCB1373223.1 hypothetical protein [Paracoccaceae bacterium]MCC0067526.1 hypothetical protein [Rhodovulum sp.]
MTPAPLALSLDHIARLLGRARAVAGQPLARSASGDPFFLDLPAFDGGAGGIVTQANLEVIGSLYFAAEVEGTYLPAVAEQLAEHRFGLNLTDRAAAEALETLAGAMRHEWVNRGLRNQIFARTFGIGDADPNLGDTVVNREFEPRFARLCSALSASARDLQGWGAPSGAAMRAAVAAQALLGNLGSRMQGNTLIVTERLAHQLTLSVEALNHPGLASLFMGRTAWDVVRGVLGTDTPDLAAHVTRAQTGLRLVTWLARHLAAVQAADAQGIIDAIAGEAGLRGWAEMWLDAAGVAPAAQPGGWPQ